MTTEPNKKAATLSLPRVKRTKGATAPETPEQELARTIRENLSAASIANKDDPPAATHEAQQTLPAIPPQEPTDMSTQDSNEAQAAPKQIHVVKMLQDYFPEYKGKKRNAQIRLNDRGYREGDIMVVQEYSELLRCKTGAEYICQIMNISQPPGLKTGHVLMHTRHLV